MTPKANPTGEMVLDFSGVKPFEALDEKVVYKIQVDSMAPATAKSSGDPKISAVFTIIGPSDVKAMDVAGEGDQMKLTGEYKVGKDGEPIMTKSKGRKLFREYSLKPDALPFLHEFIKAMDPKADLDSKTFRFNPTKYVGLTGACKIKNEVYQEQVRARVQRVLPASSYKEE